MACFSATLSVGPLASVSPSYAHRTRPLSLSGPLGQRVLYNLPPETRFGGGQKRNSAFVISTFSCQNPASLKFGIVTVIFNGRTKIEALIGLRRVRFWNRNSRARNVRIGCGWCEWRVYPLARRARAEVRTVPERLEGATEARR